MLSVDRRKDIFKLLMEQNSVKVADLAEKYKVDMSTIRRDLKALSDRYKIDVVYGGACLRREDANKGSVEEDISVKKTTNLEQKKQIAQKAARLIENGDTIILSSGSTAELVLDYLEGLSSVNIITQSLNIAAKAAMKPYASLYLVGGKYRSISGMFYGEQSVEIIKALSANKVFMGAMSVSINHGLTHQIMEEVSSLKAFLNISEEKYLIADSSKFDKVSLAKITSLDSFDGFIVDGQLPPIYREYAELHNIRIL